jgi:hypothetical protein
MPSGSWTTWDRGGGALWCHENYDWYIISC